jgi:uncharacterized membrane protein
MALVAFAVSAAGAHVLTLTGAPPFFMKAAMSQMADRGVGLHRFTLTPPITPDTQTVVRPAPDLAYSICRFDLRLGNVLASGAATDDYGSLAVFDGRTNNVATVSLMAVDGGPRAVELAIEGRSRRTDPSEAVFVRLETAEGLILIRRLAPDPAARRVAEAAAAADRCGLIEQHGEKQ